MTTEGSPGSSPEQQAAIRDTLIKINSLHQAPTLEVGELLGQFEQLDLLRVTSHPAITAALRADGRIPEVADRVKADLEIARSTGSRQAIERFQRLGVLLGVVEPTPEPQADQSAAAAPETGDQEMVRLRQEAEELTGQAVQRGLSPREVYERFVPTEDLSMLSLSQLEARAASLISEQLSKIPPYKLSKLIMGGNLTVRQVADLHPDPEADRLLDYYSQAAPARYDIHALLDEDIKQGKIPLEDVPRMTLAALRVGYRAAAKGFPSQLNETVVSAAVLDGMAILRKVWQDYDKRRGRFLIGGLTRTPRPPAVSKDEIARVGRLMVDVGYAAMAIYEYQIGADKLLAGENTLAERGSLELRPEELESLDKNISKDPGTFPLLAKYVRGLKEAEAAREGVSRQTGPLTEAPTLLGEGSPLVNPESLMGGRITNRKVERVLYADDKILPIGLGKWTKQSSSLEEAYPADPGKWVYEPRLGQQAVIKRGDPLNTRDQDALVQERAILLKLNSLFSENDPSRPVKILGYGVDEQSNPYLILEDLSSQGFVSIDTYLKDHGLLQPREALELSVAVGDLLTEIHRQGIMHQDLGDALNQSNIFWDPVNKRVRIIDWEASQDISLGGSKDYYNDRRALADMLFVITTGERLTGITAGFKKQPEGPLWQGLHPTVRGAIESSIWIKNDAFTPERTETILAGLKTALAEISR